MRFAATTLARPAGGGRTGLAKGMVVQVIDVREPAPPPNEPPVHWRLLTTHPVRNAADAWAVVELHRKCWAIEQLFQTLKTKGFDVEALQVEDSAPRDKLVAAPVAATHIQQLVHAHDGGPGPLRQYLDVFPAEDVPLLEAFWASLEGKTTRQKNPHPKRSLAYAAWVCARLGRWTGYYGKTRTHRRARRLARLPSRQTRRRRDHLTNRCVNPVALRERVGVREATRACLACSSPGLVRPCSALVVSLVSGMRRCCVVETALCGGGVATRPCARRLAPAFPQVAAVGEPWDRPPPCHAQPDSRSIAHRMGKAG